MKYQLKFLYLFATVYKNMKCVLCDKDIIPISTLILSSITLMKLKYEISVNFLILISD